MRKGVFGEVIIGRFVNISILSFPLEKLKSYFNSKELYYIFGNNIESVNLKELEDEPWSVNLVVKSNRSEVFLGFIRIIVLYDADRIIEIHGGGINNTLYEKIALTEAWLLILNECIYKYDCMKIYTTCINENQKAQNFILATGFKKTREDKNIIHFELDYFIFETIRNKYCLKN